MIEPTTESADEFAPTPDHEYQGAHYHDDDLDVVNDESEGRRLNAVMQGGKKTNRRPPPKPRHYED